MSFQLPDNIGELSESDLAELATRVREYAESVVQDPDSDIAILTAAREAYDVVYGEIRSRAETAQATADARAELSASVATPPPAPSAPPTPATESPTVTSSVPGAVTASAGSPGRTTIDMPPEGAAGRYTVITASADSAGSGGELTADEAAGVIARRLATYSTSTTSNPDRRPLSADGPGARAYRVDPRRLTRNGGFVIRRELPRELRITETSDPLRVLAHATDERRLPGGSLAASVTAAVKSGRSLTAAVGWCAPSETLYDLTVLETMDGMLDIPEVEAARGGFFAPVDGGPNFAAIFEGIGDDGDVILSEYDVENDTAKVCVEIPCPEFGEVRLDVSYICITGSLLQSRGYQEIVSRFTSGAVVALAHKVNQSVIARIVAASGPATVIQSIPFSDDAVSQLMSAVELAITDIRYHNRMALGSTLEVVLPAWVIAPMRAALARRRGVATFDVSDSEILAAFTTRGAVPRFVYDWQDAFTGLLGGPGGALPITEFPATVQFLVYPAGTWTKLVRPVINVDTVYDSALLTQNQYTALFVEDGFNVLQMSPDSRLYEVGLNAAGVVGCCDAWTES